MARVKLSMQHPRCFGQYDELEAVTIARRQVCESGISDPESWARSREDWSIDHVSTLATGFLLIGWRVIHTATARASYRPTNTRPSAVYLYS